MKRFKVLLLLVAALFIFAACDEVVPSGDATLQGVEDVTIALGDAYSRLDGITATDADGSDITGDITYEGLLNINRAGEYLITYKVTGASGVEVTATRTIFVLANARINGPELLPTNIEADSVYDALEGVTATDHDDTDITDQIVIVSDIVDAEGMVDTSQAGNFEIVYKVIGESGKEVSVTITLTIFEAGDATITFVATDPQSPTTYNLLLGTPFDFMAIARARDFDNTELDIDEVVYDNALEDWIIGTAFKPTQAGDYILTYRATGESGVQVEVSLTVHVYMQGVTIDGKYVPIFTQNINNDGKPWNSSIIYTELKGMGEYGVVAIFDAHGRLVFARDPFNQQIDINNPIKAGHPDNVRGLANNVGWTGANIFNGLLGPQGTEGGIPEGGFAIFWNRDNVAGTTHPVRTLGLETGRLFGAKIEVFGLNIPNFDPSLSANDVVFSGVEDVEIYNNETFNPLAGVVATDPTTGEPVSVEVVFNNIDMERPVTGTTAHTNPTFADGWFSVVYAATGANGYTVHHTRRVTVQAVMTDAEFSGIEDITIAVLEDFNPLAGVTASDYNNADLTSTIIMEGLFDNTEAGIYTLTYKVTGANGIEVVVTSTITVVANARFVIDPNKETEVYLDETYDVFADIEAFDADDTDLTANISVTGIHVTDGVVDTSQLGSFELIFAVTGDNGVEVTVTFTLNVVAIPNATLTLASGATQQMFVGGEFDLLVNAVGLDYDGTELTVTVSYEPDIDAQVVDFVFTPIEAGDYIFTYTTEGVNGVEVVKELLVSVQSSGLIINGTFVPVTQDNVNFDGKPANNILIFTDLVGIGEYGVVAIVDAHGRIVVARDAFGEQIDINNPFKAGNPVFPTNLSGLPNFVTYDAFTGGLWTHWTTGGANIIQGMNGPQGTEGGIPVGGFAIFFATGGTGNPARTLGLQLAREFGATVEVVNLDIPNFNPNANAQDAQILGIEDIELQKDENFDPLSGVTAIDHDGTPLTVTVAFNNVDTSKPVIPGAPRVVNTQEGRDAYAQGWYSVVYQATGDNGYTVNISRRVVVR